MKMTVVNKKLTIGRIEIGGVGSSSIVLTGNADVITSYSYFDTPESSLIFGRPIPHKPLETGGGVQGND